MSNKKIIAFTAFKRCGKDTAAAFLEKYLEKYGHKYSKEAFAQSLKNYVCNILDINIDELEKNKETDKKYIIHNKKLTIREILILFADTLRETTDDGIWAKLLFEKIKNNVNDVIIITDLRFLREYKEIINFADENNYEINIIRIKSDLPGCVMNENEVDIPKIPVKYNVINHTDKLDDFYIKLHAVFDKIFNSRDENYE